MTAAINPRTYGNDHRATGQPGSPTPWSLVSPGSRAHRVLLAGALAGGLLFTGTFLLAGATRPGYDPWRQPISALSLGPGGWVGIANFIVFGIVGVGGAIALRATLAPGRGATWVPILRLIAALSMIVVGVFTQDPSGGYPVGVPAPAAPTVHAMVHQVASFTSLIATVVYYLVLANRLAAEPQWRGWATWLRTTVVLMMIFLATFGALMSTQHGPAGTFEKAASIAAAIPGAVLAARLLTRGGMLSRPERVPNPTDPETPLRAPRVPAPPR
jgi:hypothetical protein